MSSRNLLFTSLGGKTLRRPTSSKWRNEAFASGFASLKQLSTARWRHAPAMLAHQRFQRGLRLITLLIVSVFLLTIIRVRHGLVLPSSLVSSKAAPVQQQFSTYEEQLKMPLVLGGCLPEIERLRTPLFDLTNDILYSRRCIKPVRGSKVDRKVTTKLDQPLITQRTELNLTSCDAVDLPRCERFSLQVPDPYPEEKYPNLLFGVSTTFDRLNDSLPAFAYWLSGWRSQLVAVVKDAGSETGSKRNLSALEELYKSHTINLKALPPRDSKLSVDQNHFIILADLLEAATPQTEWVGILDDDTFFPSLYKLNEALHQYDATQPMWLGALSEDFDSVRMWGFMAYGGAGVFLSVPLAEQLAPHFSSCLAQASLWTGDCILRDCIFDHTNTKLTIVPGLYQHDLHGDLSGFFESGVLPLSLHHWKSWYKEPVAKIAAVNRICGDCFLQRWQFVEDTMFTNGFSVVQYSKGVASYDWKQMEGTWSQAGREFDFSLGPLRPALDTGEKKSYRLKDARFDKNGDLTQTYVYKGDFMKEEIDEVLELIWEVGEPETSWWSRN